MKKIIIVSAAAAVAMFGAAGVAYAGDENTGADHHHHSGGNSHSRWDGGDNNTNCSANDTIHQSNQGRQFIGGNLAGQDAAANVLGAQSTRPVGICPSIGNNNHL